MDIRGEAEAFLCRHGFDGRGVVDMPTLLDRSIGLKNVWVVPPGADSDFGAYTDHDQQIHVQASLSCEWQRYFLARELGHIALGHYAVTAGEPQREADYFAMHILIPRRALALFRARYPADRSLLSTVFLAPLRVVHRRIEEDADIFVARRGGAVGGKTMRISAGGGGSIQSV